jgi:MinD superfamily P-loop ATPase
MPDNYIKILKIDSPEIMRERLKNAVNEVGKIAKIVNENRNVQRKNIFGFMSYLINFIWQEKVHESDKSFFILSGCNSCCVCEKVCPVNNIKLVNGKPEWRHNCEECLACINFCPKEVIQTKYSLDKGRYINPEIKLKDMMLQKS